MINSHKLYIIVAADQNLGIGKSGKMPWDLPGDLKHFQKITTETRDPSKQNMVIMGRTTWESIPENHRPLMGRENVVLTRNPDLILEEAEVAGSLDLAFDLADESIETVFIMGGGKLYAEVIDYPALDGIYLTHIHKIYDCDTYFPVIPERFSKKTHLGSGEDHGIKYDFVLYEAES